MNQTLQRALMYRRAGFSVIPVKPRDKKPLVNWEPYQKEAASEETIKHWFMSWPDANLAIVTGRVSGCVVIDLDNAEAKDKLKSLIGSDLSHVPRTKTGKGWHLYFKHPGVNVPNKVSVVPGLDTRSDGGCAIAPPSIHQTGKQYKWEVAPSDSNKLPELPKELLKLVTATSTTQSGSTNRQRLNTAEALRGKPEGERRQIIFRLAAKLRHTDVPKEVTAKLILEAAANCEPPFPEREALAQVEDVYRRYPAGGRNGTREEPRVEIPPELPEEEPAREQPHTFPEIAWDGLFARWRDIVAPCTEAPLETLWGVFLLVAGMVVGRSAWRQSPRPLYPNFFLLILGQTGDSRKSTIMWLACELLRHVGEEFKSLDGIVSSEGIYEALAEHEGTKALIYADEFRALLSVAKRKGTQDILPRLNSLYYCPEHASIDRVKDSTKIVKPFLSLITATPQAYVEDLLSELEITGGFLNRFLILTGEEQAPKAIVKSPSPGAWESIAAGLREIRGREIGEIELTEETTSLWTEFYTGWKTERRSWQARQANLSARIFEHVLKIAVVYAVLGGERQITTKTLAIAIAIGEWLQSNALRLFADTNVDHLGKCERAIVDLLKRAKGGRMWRRHLQQLISGRGFNSELFNRTIKALEGNDQIRCRAIPGPTGRERRIVEYIRLNA